MSLLHKSLIFARSRVNSAIRSPLLARANNYLPSSVSCTSSTNSGIILPFLYSHVPVRGHCDSDIKPDAKSVTVSFVDKDGKSRQVVGKVGQNLVHLAHENDIELEGACECSLACSTCHVILEPKVHAALSPACEEEEDLLDLAFGLTSTSRLGCQVTLTTDMEGANVKLPSATRNFYVDGHKPKPH